MNSVQEDAVLVVECRGGDREAFAELYRRHAAAARAAARSITGSAADAEDVTSEVFLRLWRVMTAGGGPTASVRAYLMTSVRHVCVDRARRRHMVPSGRIDEMCVSSAPSADELAMHLTADERAVVRRAVAALPERWRTALEVGLEHDGSARALAEAMHIAPNAAAALTYRAREGLRQAYLVAHVEAPDDPTCRWCVNRLGAHVRGRSSDHDRARVVAHLSGCAVCADIEQRLRELDADLPGHP